MIQIVLRGGLGNQMFEYAAGLAVAKKYHTGLLIDTTYLEDRFPRKDFTYRHYELDAFALTPHFTALSRAAHAVPIPGVWLGLDLGLLKARDILYERKLITEKEERKFDPSVMEAGSNVCLWGYWQSEKYFMDAKDEVANAFAFSKALSPAAEELAAEIRNSNSVSLSVRRGDYVKAANAKIFGDTDLGYYDRAIKHISSQLTDPHFFIFSDDVAWCREHITMPFKTTYVSPDLDGPAVMQLASLCRHNIMANSSFSWWGAWLNRNPEKIVIAPQRWTADGKNQADAVPPEWMRI